MAAWVEWPGRELKPVRRAGGFWLLAGALWLGWAIWLLRFPPGLPSDDALFFARGLLRFSVAEFSPHFPGYPGLMLLGRALLPLAGDPVRALHGLSLLSVLVLPPLAARLAQAITGRREAARRAFLLMLTQPLLPLVGLSLLSDGPGLLCFLLGLLALAQRQPLLAGLLLGGSLGCRPSDAPLWAGGVLYLLLYWRPLGWRLLAGALLVLLPLWGGVLVQEGGGYWEEGLRFVNGHLTQWGGTALVDPVSRVSWMQAAARQPLLVLYGVLLAVLVLAIRGLTHGPQRPASPLPGLLDWTLASALLWTLPFQNPDNLRHLAPLLVLAGLRLSLMPLEGGMRIGPVAVAVLGLILLLPALVQPPRPAPLMAAAHALQRSPAGLLVTRHGVTLLRERLEAQRVYDAHYRAQVDYVTAQATGPVWRLSSTPLTDLAVQARFPGRVPGEPELWLYRLR